jgi:hypothetical protein
MKRLSIACCAVSLLLSSAHPAWTASSTAPAPLLPESLAARAEMASNQKSLTILIKNEDPEKATAALNASNEEYGKKGWSVLSILTYTNDGDFEGFFVTYQKSLVIE